MIPSPPKQQITDNALHARELVRYNMSQGRKARNQTGGGGGAPTAGRYHVLYAALKTTKPGIKKRAGKHKLR